MTLTLNTRYWTPAVAAVTVPNRSIDFEVSSGQLFSMAAADFGALNSKKWTYHTWFKKETDGTTMFLVLKGNSGASVQPVRILFTSGNALDIRVFGAGVSLLGRLTTSTTFTAGTWYQMVVYWDSANATSTDRLQLWIDRSRVSSFSVNTQPSLNADMADNNTDAHMYIGDNNTASYDGLLYQQAWFNNALPAISSLHNSNSPTDITGVSGLYSLLNTTDASTLEDDYVLSANWTNTNSVVKSTDIPV